MQKRRKIGAVPARAWTCMEWFFLVGISSDQERMDAGGFTGAFVGWLSR